MPKVQLLVGMIASGKSTYGREQAKQGTVIVNDDLVIQLVHGDYRLYDDSLKLLYKAIEIQLATLALAAGRNVIVDSARSNIHLKGRQRWISLTRSMDIPCEAIIFPKESPEVHAERRVRSDSRGLTYEKWLQVANKHAELYQEPTEEEGLTRVIYV